MVLLLLKLFCLRIENYLSTLTNHNLMLLPTLSSDLQNLTRPGWIPAALGSHNYLPGNPTVMARTGDNYLLSRSECSSGSY